MAAIIRPVVADHVVVGVVMLMTYFEITAAAAAALVGTAREMAVEVACRVPGVFEGFTSVVAYPVVCFVGWRVNSSELV